MMRECAEYCALWDTLLPDEQEAFLTVQNAPDHPRLTDKIWFNILTLFLPKLFVVIRKKSRPTDESIVKSNFFVQWMRLALCAEGVAVPTSFAPLCATWQTSAEEDLIQNETAE